MNILKNAVTATVCVSVFLLAGCPSIAQDDDNRSDAQKLFSAGDFLLSLDTTVIEPFLEYKGSSFASPARVRVWYSLKLNQGKQWSENKRYEDLWCHDGKAIGLHRYCDLSPLARKMGYIYVRTSNNQSDQTKSIANAIVRLLVDVTAVKGVLVAVIVQKDIYNQVVSDVEDLGFGKMTEVVGDGRPVLLHLRSDPAGSENYLYYTGGQSPN